MKALKIFKRLILSFSLVLGTACNSTSPSTDDDSGCGDLEIIKEASNRKGTIGYNSSLNKYLVFSGIEGSYDSQDVGILCKKLPEKFATEGLQIVFSGEYHNYPGEINHEMPGQTYFYLDIDHISLEE